MPGTRQDSNPSARGKTAGKSAGETGRPVVLQVLPWLDDSGTARGSIDVAAAVAQAGAGSLIASGGGARLRELPRQGVEHFEVALTESNPIATSRAAKQLVKIIGDHGVGIVHARGRTASKAALWAIRRVAPGRKPKLVTTFKLPRRSRIGLKARYESPMLSGDRVIATSRHLAEQLGSGPGADASKVRLVHPGIDFEAFDPARVSDERVIQLATRWRIGDGAPLVIVPGRLDSGKDFRTLIESLRHLGAEMDLTALLLPPAPVPERARLELEELIRKRGVEGRVAILDDCRDMPAAYKLCDAVISVDTWPESFSRIVSEAQAMGKPVIASREGGVGEQIIPGQTGVLVAPGDSAGIVSALQAVTGLSSEERRTLAELAIAHTREHYAKETMCEVTLELYGELLGAEAEAGGDELAAVQGQAL